jgi:hypothetical protein
MYLLTMTNTGPLTVFTLCIALAGVFADTLPAIDSVRIVLPLGLTPLFDVPAPGGFPISYLEPSDTCRIDSARFDTANVEWAFVRSQSRSGWLQKSSLRPALVPPMVPQSKANKPDADAKRRYRVLGQHPEWERRIVKVIREGKICLDMSEEQVLASWDEPLQKSVVFILGAGKQNIWLYKSPSGRFETVFLVNGRVVGWSE